LANGGGGDGHVVVAGDGASGEGQGGAAESTLISSTSAQHVPGMACLPLPPLSLTSAAEKQEEEESGLSSMMCAIRSVEGCSGDNSSGDGGQGTVAMDVLATIDRIFTRHESVAGDAAHASAPEEGKGEETQIKDEPYKMLSLPSPTSLPESSCVDVPVLDEDVMKSIFVEE
jgi:hypothetical protein